MSPTYNIVFGKVHRQLPLSQTRSDYIFVNAGYGPENDWLILLKSVERYALFSKLHAFYQLAAPWPQNLV